MFSKHKDDNSESERDHTDRNVAQYGFFDVPSDFSFDDSGIVDENNSDLEAELLALTEDSKRTPRQKSKQKLASIPTADLDGLVTSSLKNVPSNEDISADESNPDLINELKELTQDATVKSSLDAEPGPAQVSEQTSDANIKQILEVRLKMYVTAEENAKKFDELTRARRFNRGIKTLKDLIEQADAGRPINNDDIPPEVAVTIANKSAPQPINSVDEPVQPTVPDNTPEAVSNYPEPLSSILNPTFDPDLPSKSEITPVNHDLPNLLTRRRDQYKTAALQLKKSGDIPTAVGYMKTAKQFEAVIKAVENGEAVDLSQMPGSPGEDNQNQKNVNANHGKKESETQRNTENISENIEDEPEEQLITASSILEALEQRLQVYKSKENTSKTEGNTSKARSMDLIIKQFEQAIKLHKLGELISFDELPTPPGFAPIPGATAPQNTPQPSPRSVQPLNDLEHEPSNTTET